MAKTDKPQCRHCFGTNWNEIAVLDEKTGLCIWQCGHGPADAEEMNNGCSRVISATRTHMHEGGII